MLSTQSQAPGTGGGAACGASFGDLTLACCQLLGCGSIPQPTQSSVPLLRGLLLWVRRHACVFVCQCRLIKDFLWLQFVFSFLFIVFLSNPLPQVLSAELLSKCILNFVLFFSLVC